jgi:hypothetical protein
MTTTTGPRLSKTFFPAVGFLFAQALGPPLVAQGGHLFTTIPAIEMVHADLGGKILNQTLTFGGWSAYCLAFCEFVADARLPHGARVVGIEIDACRDAAGDRPIDFGLLRRKPNDSGGFARLEVLVFDTVDTTGCTYRTAVPAGPIVVDTFVDGEYLVAVLIGSSGCGVGANPPCPDSGSRFQAMRVYYEPNAHGGVLEPSQRSSFSPFP